MTRVFSGIQPTGNLHLGNYLGAIANWVAMQDAYECIYCIVDLHAITDFQTPATLRSATRDMTAALLASGIDPARSILFNQSRVSVHAELAWILECVARVGWTDRMTQFKQKSGKDREGASVGLYVYPVLQAADILAYKATHVPVGDDQKQHLELARDIAIKFNTDYGVDLFPVPEPVIGVGAAAGTARVMSLRDGTAKMSKSDPSAMSRIDLTDDADAIANKIKRAKTDPEPLPSEAAGLEGRPEARNLVGLYAALAGVLGGGGARRIRRSGLRPVQAAPRRTDRRAPRPHRGALPRPARRRSRARPHARRRRGARPRHRAAGARRGACGGGFSDALR